MASRFVSAKKLFQKFPSSSRQQFTIDRTIATRENRAVGRVVVFNNTCDFNTSLNIRGDSTPPSCDSLVGRQRLASTNKRGGSVNLSKQVTSAAAMKPPRNDDRTKPEKAQTENMDPKGTSEQTSNPSTTTNSVTYDDQDKYSIEIDDGFMKISMKPVSTSGTNVSVIPKKGSSLLEKNIAEGDRINGCDKQEDGRDTQTRIPETVLQFQRQLRKTQAAKRASTPLDKSQLNIVYDDEHIVVVNKPSGVLTVPGINSNPSMLTVLYDKYKKDLDPEMKPEHMIVHRLDMDTSGIVVYAKSKKNLLALQALFRNRDEVSKSYESVVCGHLHPDVVRGSIDLPLQRDHRFPPFMRVATPKSEREAQEVVKDLKKAGWKKIVKKKAKPSQTLFEVIGREYLSNENGKDFPVTRLRLTLLTGRTHQLRVHCAAIGHPILGDPAYGIYGEASPNGGFDDALMDELVPTRASMDLQLALDQYVKDKDQVMCLHARQLRVQHPETGNPLTFEQPPAF